MAVVVQRLGHGLFATRQGGRGHHGRHARRPNRALERIGAYEMNATLHRVALSINRESFL